MLSFKVNHYVRKDDILDEAGLEKYIKENFDSAEAAYYIITNHYYEFIEWMGGAYPVGIDFLRFLQVKNLVLDFLEIEILA